MTQSYQCQTCKRVYPTLKNAQACSTFNEVLPFWVCKNPSKLSYLSLEDMIKQID